MAFEGKRYDSKRGGKYLMDFSLKLMINMLRKRFKWIALLTLIGLGGFYSVNRYVLSPVYTASVQLYVNADDTTSSADINVLNYAQKVVNTYISFLRTQVFYSRVIEETGLDYNLKELKKMTEIKAVNNTEVFEIKVNSYRASEAYQLVEAMQSIAPELIKEIKTSAAISVVDPVVYPMEPSGPNILINTAAGGMLGFLLAVLATFLWELIDVKVKDDEDFIRKYQLPMIGSIPDFDGRIKKRVKLSKILTLHKKPNRKKRVDRILNKDSDFLITEAYKALRTNLRYTLRKEGCRKLLINSPTPEDGKSTTCLNIAITIAQTGARVLMMDCDLRKGRLHKALRLKNYPGISDVLSGIVMEKEVIQNTYFPNLKLISMGTLPPNPTELLASAKMEELLQSLEKSYDYILIDSPPVNVVSDAMSLMKLVDGILIVVKENHTTHPNIADALTKYKLVGANTLGFVMNGITMKKGNRTKSNYYYEGKSND